MYTPNQHTAWVISLALTKHSCCITYGLVLMTALSGTMMFQNYTKDSQLTFKALRYVLLNLVEMIFFRMII